MYHSESMMMNMYWMSGSAVMRRMFMCRKSSGIWKVL